jgi:hypothetical protein
LPHRIVKSWPWIVKGRQGRGRYDPGMIWLRRFFANAPAARAIGLACAIVLITLAPPAAARGGHGFGGHHGFGGSRGEGFAGHGMRGEHFVGSGRRGNDDYVKAASTERDRLLNTSIRSI